MLIESRITLAGEQQLADTPAFTKGTAAHPCTGGGNHFYIPNFKAKTWLCWKEKGLWHRTGPLHEHPPPQKSPSKQPQHHLPRVLVCVQCLQFNSQLDSLLEGYLPGRAGPKKNQCSIFLGLYLFFTGWVVINTQACGKK